MSYPNPFAVAQTIQSAATNREQLAALAQERQFAPQMNAEKLAALQNANTSAPLELQQLQLENDKLQEQQDIAFGSSIYRQIAQEPARANEIYQSALALQKAKKRDVSALPQEYNDDAAMMLENLNIRAATGAKPVRNIAQDKFEYYQQLKQTDPAAAREFGLSQKYIMDANGGPQKGSEQLFYESLTAGLTPEQQRDAGLVKLRLKAGAVGNAAYTAAQNGDLDLLANATGQIAGSQEVAKLEKQLELEPQIARAVDTAKSSVAESVKQNSKNKSNTTAFNVYQTGMRALAGAFGETSTGPIVGLIPALTSSQQKAQGAVDLVAPLLKDIFREAGEGSFTEGDQKLLTNMIPKRTDTPESVKFKLETMDSILSSKLNPTGNQQQTPATNTKRLTFNPATGRLE